MIEKNCRKVITKILLNGKGIFLVYKWFSNDGRETNFSEIESKHRDIG